MDKKAQWSLVAAAWVLAIGVIGMGVYALRRFNAAAQPPAPAQVQTFGTAAKPLCPVDHVEITLGPDTPKVNFNGNTYYFCDTKDPLGRTHKALFLMDPLLYLTGVSTYATPVPASGSQAVTLTPAASAAPLSASPAAAAVPLSAPAKPLAPAR